MLGRMDIPESGNQVAGAQAVGLSGNPGAEVDG